MPTFSKPLKATTSAPADAHLVNPNSRPLRKTTEKAYQAAPWIGAAPKGSRKRAGSATLDDADNQPQKKIKPRAQQKSQEKPHVQQKARTPAERPEPMRQVKAGNLKGKTRYPPPVIPDDSDLDHEEPEYTSGKDDMDTLSHGEDDEDDLETLPVARLKDRLASERPQWSTSSSTHGTVPVENPFDDENSQLEDFEEHIPPPTTTASEFEGGFDEEVSEESSRPMDVGRDDYDEDSEVETRAASKRDVARRSEVPRWKTSSRSTAPPKGTRYRDNQKDSKTTRKSHCISDSSENEDSNQDINEGWPEQAHYLQAAPGTRNISILAQPQPMRVTLRLAVSRITAISLFKTAFPSLDPRESRKHHRETLVKSAKTLGYTELAHRFSQDDDLVVVSARVLNARISNIRTRAKKITDGKAEGFFQLIAGESEIRVKSLLREFDYIYPLSVNGKPNTKKPFLHPAIISSLKECFFMGSRTLSYADTYAARFSSSIKEGPKKVELEVPIAMLCLIVTTLHASLDDWSEGHRKKKRDFRADTYADIYQGHELFLKNLQMEQLPLYHEIMSDLYKAVGSTHTRSASHMANNAMARLNLPVTDELE